MGSDDSLKVLISTDCGEKWTPLRAFTALNGLSNSLTPFTVNISAYAGQNCRIAFLATDGNINNLEDYEIHLDSISMGAVTVSVGSDVLHKNIRIYPNPCIDDRLYIKTSGDGEEIRFFFSFRNGIFSFPDFERTWLV
jgi:hypothetical protein